MFFTKLCVVIVIRISLYSCSRFKEIRTFPVYTESAQTENTAQASPNEAFELPPPTAGERDIFKIQILATTNYEWAEIEKKNLQKLTDKTIYVLNEESLWKVQVGDFLSREDSEIELSRLKNNG